MNITLSEKESLAARSAHEESLPAVRKKLLCATDLAPRSDQAVLRAVLLAKQMNAEVQFVHAVDDAHRGRVLRMKVNRAQARLMSQSERAMEHAPQDATASVRLGKPLQVIAAAADEWNPDLIVMAAPRRRRMDRLIGTTAERVIHATQRPVLIVSGAAQRHYENVVIATDLSAASVHVARTALTMGMLEDACAWVVHAFQPPYHGMTASAALVEEQIADHKRRWRDVVTRDLVQELVEEGVEPSRVHVAVEAARPLDAIELALQRANPELLVIGASRWFMLKRLLFGSVADQVLRRIQCDILAISPPAGSRRGERSAVNRGFDPGAATQRRESGSALPV